MKFARSVVVVASFMAAGCVTVGEDFRKNGLKQAAFDLGCPDTQVQTSFLVGEETQVGWVPEPVVGVSGCGKKASYVSYGPNEKWQRREKAVEVSTP